MVMQSKQARVEKEKAMQTTVRQRATLFSKPVVRTRSSPRVAVAAFIRQGDRGRACRRSFAKALPIPHSVSLALRDEEGDGYPAKP